jgi:peptide methionine sulfoxide reductase MsrA
VADLERKGFDIVTKMVRAGQFWPGPDYHQEYYERSGERPYCHARVKRF